MSVRKNTNPRALDIAPQLQNTLKCQWHASTDCNDPNR